MSTSVITVCRPTYMLARERERERESNTRYIYIIIIIKFCTYELTFGFVFGLVGGGITPLHPVLDAFMFFQIIAVSCCRHRR